MTTATDITKLHKSIHSYMKRKALSYESNLSDSIKKYLRSQKKYASRSFKISNTDELFRAIHSSKIVYLGDFHTFSENSRNLERLMRELVQENGHFALGTELVMEENQSAIDRYLSDEITELEFLKEIKYHESWKFPWNHYKTFFEIAKENDFDIIALNSKGSLKTRDQNAAKIISEYITEHPDSILLVLFGELHIIPDKLPLQVKKKLGDKTKQTIIHQNLDEVFWKIQETDDHQIVKFNEHEYSLQTSPPWIKYESMVYWYENLSDDPEFDIHEYEMETKHKGISSNAHENFLYICNKILKAFDMEISDTRLEDFNLYGYRKLPFVMNKINSIQKSPIANFYKSLITNGRTFKIPMNNIYYCSNYSINRLAFLAGSHLHSILLSTQNKSVEKILYSNNQSNRFLFFLYQCLIAYFSSKIINPYRKCDLYQDIKARYKSPATKQHKRNNLKLALDIMEKKGSLENLLKGRSIKGLYSSAKTIGNFMADILYDEYFKISAPVFEELKTLILNNNHKEEDFFKLLNMILPAKKIRSYKKRSF